MSTRYYALRPPVTSVRVEEAGGHASLSIWVSHGGAGKLVLAKQDLKPFLKGVLANEDDVVMHVTCGGEHALLCRMLHYARPEDLVISEYGELMTVRDVQDDSTVVTQQ